MIDVEAAQQRSFRNLALDLFRHEFLRIQLLVANHCPAIGDRLASRGARDLEQPSRAAGLHDIVRIDETDVLAARNGNAGIPRRVRSAVLDADDPQARIAERREYLGDRLLIAIVDDDQFQFASLLVQRALDRLLKPVRPWSPDRHDQADECHANSSDTVTGRKPRSRRAGTSSATAAAVGARDGVPLFPGEIPS